MRGLHNKVAIIAGAVPDNIGGATAIRLAEEGSHVVVADLNGDGAAELAERIRQAGGSAHAEQVDVTSETSVQALVAATVSRFGGVDGLFNVAADLSRRTLGTDTDVLRISDETFRRTIDVSLMGYLYATRHVLPIMVERGGGSIVNTMSAAVWMAEPIRVAYSATKAAVAALTRHTATVAGRQGVRCNAIAPGTVRTPANVASMTPEEVDRQLATVRSPRLGVPEDIAAMVAFLFSDDASWINGQTIVVDGGAILR
ncbi:SDR family oxidoreductase [Dactylosporangium sp. NPDC005572]|uniref:SDR family NAD(P)-dependent oxidoreductase n=1 Tax=Dactylosporangium sp. NPDC005572 TaxID=3156889 RepID=UPI0033A8D2D0